MKRFVFRICLVLAASLLFGAVFGPFHPFHISIWFGMILGLLVRFAARQSSLTKFAMPILRCISETIFSICSGAALGVLPVACGSFGSRWHSVSLLMIAAWIMLESGLYDDETNRFVVLALSAVEILTAVFVHRMLGGDFLILFPLFVIGGLAWLSASRWRFPGRTFRREASEGLAGGDRLALLGLLAHEIRTPLSVMQTTEELLLGEHPGPLNETQKRFLESLAINTRRLIGFSENLLSRLKINSGWKPSLEEKVDLKAIATEVAETFSPMLSIHGQSISCAFPALLSQPVTDEVWVRQVLTNLVHNAAKHLDAGGHILISASQDDDQVIVSVSDDGTGLMGEGRDILFHEYYQEAADIRQKRDGFGLGLAIVKVMVGKLGGSVCISGTDGHGTIVSFSLPSEAIR
ncbi:MAG: ATP-binding protein [Sphaerochaetaceae bacterium]|jgi:signal transduction histidine kinase